MKFLSFFDKFKLLPILLLLLNLKETNSYWCELDNNCPRDRAICLRNYCECTPGYKTLITDQTIDGKLAPYYCTYRQTSRYIPLILEAFLPSIGHFYIGRYFHAVVKFLLIVPLIFRQKGSNLSLFLIFLFCLLYVVDLLCIYLCIYYDGNGIALY